MLKKIVNFILLVLFVLLVKRAYCLSLDKVKIYFLSSDYKSAILEGEKILAGYRESSVSDELYYILGLSYLKDENYLRASDIFEIILKEFKDSPFKEEARLGLGDIYFLRSDFAKAKEHYQELLNRNPRSKFKAQVYYRLSQIEFKKGNTQLAAEYLKKLKTDFPLSPEARLNPELYSASDIYYTVQVGSFLNSLNAKNLAQKLKDKGYPAYVEEAASDDKTNYRVRAGKFSVRQQAQELENKLSQEGYPTRVYP